MWANSYVGENKREDLVAEASNTPSSMTFGNRRSRAWLKSTCRPTLSQLLELDSHTGTFRGWREIGSQEKWLRIHRTMEWPDFNEEAHKRDLLRFFDHYLKGHENGWEQTPASVTLYSI